MLCLKRGGGSKAFWTMFKITAPLMTDGFPKEAFQNGKLSLLVLDSSLYNVIFPTFYCFQF